MSSCMFSITDYSYALYNKKGLPHNDKSFITYFFHILQ